MTKQESLNKAAQEFGYDDFDKFILFATGIIPIVEREEIENIIHRAMDIFAEENETREMLRQSLADMTAKRIFEKEAGGWISVEERLPEENCEVLVYFGTDIVQAYLKGGYWKGSSLVTDSMNDGFVTDRRLCKQGDVFDYVTHWQPLPTAP